MASELVKDMKDPAITWFAHVQVNKWAAQFCKSHSPSLTDSDVSIYKVKQLIQNPTYTHMQVLDVLDLLDENLFLPVLNINRLSIGLSLWVDI